MRQVIHLIRQLFKINGKLFINQNRQMSNMQSNNIRRRKNIFFARFVLYLAILLFVTGASVTAQDLLKGTDLSTIRVDDIPDAEIVKFQSQLQANNITMAQSEQMAIQKGMPQAEFNKLKERVSRMGQLAGAGNTAAVAQEPRQVEKSDYKTFQRIGSDAIFGSLLFSTPSLSFEPNLRIGMPAGYILGPDDELVISVSGYQEANIKTQVTAEGIIQIPQVGSIGVNGLTLEEATMRIKGRMAKTAYPNLNSGLTQVAITLGKIRSIHITILGAVKPGNYTVSSLTSVFNSLYQSGGPGVINSYRRIELLRGGKLFKTIDLYQFLTKGDQSGNVTLKENDVINIPVYQKRATIEGEVKRPGIFELLDGETMETLIAFAGGFTERAYTSALKIKLFTETDRQIKDLPKSNFTTYQPGNGDVIEVGAVLQRVENSVKISGAVYRPGEFEFTPGLTVSNLIKKASGVREDVFMERAIITRTHADQTKENLSFNLKDLLNGSIPDIVLLKKDEVQIASVTTFRDQYTVTIDGEVRKPGTFAFKDNFSLKDLLFSAGNFTEAGSAYRIEVARRVNSDIVSSMIDTVAQVFDINTDRDLTLKGEAFLLKPFDIIHVRKKPGYIEQKQVSITGEVLYPGAYTIQSKKERISDLINRSGGLTSLAFKSGVSLIRNYTYDSYLQEDKIAKAEIISKSIKDTSGTAIADVSRKNEKIAIDIDQVLNNPGSKGDYLLEEGDEINVPKSDPLIKVSGEVFQSTKTGYEENMGMKYYLDKAGGVTDKAKLSKSYVFYPNGQIARTRSFLFGIFRTYPKVVGGSEIVVPKRLERRKLTAAETIGITSAFLSLVSLLIVTISTLNR
jgi:protein involved in polysaccharide export with SLBB domain